MKSFKANEQNNQVYIKSHVEFHEYNMHNYIWNLGIANVPEIISYDKKTKTLQMEKIPGLSVSDMYGEAFTNAPDAITNKIRDIILILKSHNIIYPDITGYNFIERDGSIWIIDFEHAYFGFDPTQSNWFVDEFISGRKSWNPDFI
jgi:tRNA A-37 threonylcarbamoyl transferase component Bud32